MLWWHLILCSVLHHITDTCSHSTYSHIPTPTWLPFNRWSYVCSPRSINHLPQYPRHRQLQYFCRLLGLQLLFLLCQLLILLRLNCDLAISNLIIRNFAHTIAITSGLSSPGSLINHPFHQHHRLKCVSSWCSAFSAAGFSISLAVVHTPWVALAPVSADEATILISAELIANHVFLFFRAEEECLLSSKKKFFSKTCGGSLACVFWFGIKSRKMVVVGTIFFVFFLFSFSFHSVFIIIMLLSFIK